ncbi:PREDICTED: uncharacterized protein LOC109230206 [Nicotiana attenuata]|uniref:uncharacterized protein LOC109230206 n=1 Tax=Nicotiana attenuata TaxID=49451 RepID=UPI000905A5BD|nr:PREDICTED: uncharacterized protein LOC109230206 [Nicotiana attenuata]
MREESLVQAKKIEELEPRLVAELAKAASAAEKAKADVEAVVAVHRADAEAANARVKEIFDAAQNAKVLEGEVEYFLSDDDDSGSVNGSESGEDEDEAPEKIRLKAIQKRESPAKESDSSSDSKSFISASEGEEHESSDTEIIQEIPEGWASYDPKKRKSISQKAPTVLKPAKKRKTSPPKSTAPSVPNGRATRSRFRQSKADLQTALEESKKKKKEKGKKKVAESSEATEEEEMELVHQERGTTVEIPLPKPKRSKTSTKKSSCEPVSGEPLLAKRTRRKILKGRLLKDQEEPGMRRLVDALAAQGDSVTLEKCLKPDLCRK